MQVSERKPSKAQVITKRISTIARNLENKYKSLERKGNLLVDYIGSRGIQRIVAEANEMIVQLARMNHTCNSKVMIDYVLILRYTHRCPHPNELFSLMKFHLNIHRPSFKLCAALLTTYITGALKYAASMGCSPQKIHFVRSGENHLQPLEAPGLKELEASLKECTSLGKYSSNRDIRVGVFQHFFEHAHFCREVMENVHNYTLNSFLFNQMLSLYQAYTMHEPFWDAVVKQMREKSIDFDRETYALVLTQCVQEHKINTGKAFFEAYQNVEKSLAQREHAKGKRFQREMRHAPNALAGRLADIEKKAVRCKTLCLEAGTWILQQDAQLGRWTPPENPIVTPTPPPPLPNQSVHLVKETLPPLPQPPLQPPIKNQKNGYDTKASNAYNQFDDVAPMFSMWSHFNDSNPYTYT